MPGSAREAEAGSARGDVDGMLCLPRGRQRQGAVTCMSERPAGHSAVRSAPLPIHTPRPISTTPAGGKTSDGTGSPLLPALHPVAAPTPRPAPHEPKPKTRSPTQRVCSIVTRSRPHSFPHPTHIPPPTLRIHILHPATSGHFHPLNLPDVRERTSEERAASAVPFLLPRNVLRRTAVRRRRRETRSGCGHVRTAVVEEEHMSHGTGSAEMRPVASKSQRS
ncbi:hypothetical protein B0H14DRAFT_2561348 [Mycena olivaceomarginata]|nr:hypothetical protein B0H14DRAFT_2561348 [Mycena olivaceomarginata]